ncbi:MAG: hypothetical protein ACJ739_10035 [Acidimicrobiales bacterium]
MRRWVLGTAVALAVAFPAVVVARILDAVLDDGLPAALTIALVAMVLAGPVVGGLVAGRRPGSGPVGIAIGATCLFLISSFGVLLRAAADESVAAYTIPLLTVLGGLLGLVGDLAARAGRTRR